MSIEVFFLAEYANALETVSLVDTGTMEMMRRKAILKVNPDHPCKDWVKPVLYANYMPIVHWKRRLPRKLKKQLKRKLAWLQTQKDKVKGEAELF